MRIQFYLSTLVLIISCGQSPKTEKNPSAQAPSTLEAIEVSADTILKKEEIDFSQTIANFKTQSLPRIEATNFDSFIDEDDYKELDFKAFKLDKIYPDFNAFDNNFKAISAYTVPISDSFHTVVITVQKNENEMETVLINYDSTGEILAHKIASYDEIAEGWSQIVSRISENQLTVNRVFWGEIKQVEQEEYILHPTGEIEKIDAKSLNETVKNFVWVDAALTELQLDWIQTKTSLITTAPYPSHPNETIVVIPEIVDEGIQYFDLNAYIVIADKRSGSITHTYFESHQMNDWESDAVRLDEIKIDSTLYEVSENTSAFGLNVSHFGSSRVNPHANKTLSLFVKSGDSLVKLLSNYTVEDYGGEWNGDCDGEFIEEKKRVTLSPEKTNGYFDLNVTTTITYSKNAEAKKGECLTTEKDETKNTILKYNGWRYSEYDSETNMYSEFHPKKLTNVQLDKFDVQQAFELNGFKIVAAYYEPVDGKMVAPDSEKDWGDSLLMLDASNEIVYKSQGVGDVYLFEPHFYKSKASDKTIIICQLAFEYPLGGEVFMLENEKITYIGTLDIEGYDPEQTGLKYLTEIVAIIEKKDTVEFSFKSDKLVLNPGSEDEVFVNNNIRYVYKKNELSLPSYKR